MDKPKIMIVDDEVEIRDVLKIYLSKDYEVITAKNGIEAMQFFLTEQPVVIITDVNMPYMSGIELLKSVKEFSPSTEVIVMTGYMTQEILTEANLSGAFDCVSKPVNIKNLKSVFHEAIDKTNVQFVG